MVTGLTFTARTTLLGLRLSTVIAIAIAALAASVTVVVFFLLRHRRSRRLAMRAKHAPVATNPARTKEIAAVFIAPEKAKEGNLAAMITAEAKLEKVVFSGGDGIAGCSSSSSSSPLARMGIMAENMGWGRWYSLRELEEATGGFDEKNVIGEGGYGIVYRGVLPDRSVVAVKNLLNKKSQAEKEFKVEVEVIGKVRHKNLVGLIGYCAEGPKRMLVYEFVENGNLEQWLHGDVGPVSPLTWDIRMKIAIGTAKGIAYLHEGLEPKVVHRDIKSSNILLDRQFNPKVSDFGLAKLLGPGSSYVTTRVMGTFGYVAPEYACTGMLNEGSDIYSFGVLLMELISGRPPVDYGRSVGEVNLVDWFKAMVSSKCGEEVLDPRIDYRPSPRALKRVLLVCLRCIDSDAHKRPKMGQIAHMLEGDEFPFRMEHRSPRQAAMTTSTAGPAAIGRIPFPPKADR